MFLLLLESTLLVEKYPGGEEREDKNSAYSCHYVLPALCSDKLLLSGNSSWYLPPRMGYTRFWSTILYSILYWTKI
jgi:hypothetical protein